MLDNPVQGSFLIIAAMVLDTIDGLAARALKVKSELGKQLDSLADLISFGIAPAYMYYNLFGNTEALLASIFYALSALFRLAKFNTQEYSTDFNGLPSPAAAGILSGYVLLYALDTPNTPVPLPLMAIIAPAICMNIRMKFFSLKGLSILKDPKFWFVVLVTVLSLILDWHYSLLVCFLSYLFVSFAGGLARKMARNKKKSL